MPMQAKGESARLLVGFETTFNQLPGTPNGVILPINTCGLKADQKLNKTSTLRGRRDPAQPYYGFVDASGDTVVPLDGSAMGYWLKALLGQPVSTEKASESIGNGPAVDHSNGRVGIPVTAHGIPVGCQVTITGTTHYNNTYTVDPLTTVNEVVLTAAYITTFQAETFSAGVIQPLLYTHVFKVQPTQPSMFVEKGFTDINQFEVFTGVKTGKLALSVGGDKELEATVSLIGCNSQPMSSTSIQVSPATVPLARFQFDQGFIYQGGQSLAIVTEFSLNMDMDLDNSVYPIGNQGMRGAVPEGIMALSGTMKTMFEDASLVNLGIGKTVTTIKLMFSRAIESMTFEYQEVNLARTSPPIDTPKGIYASLDYEAFYNTGSYNSAIQVTLVNQVSGY